MKGPAPRVAEVTPDSPVFFELWELMLLNLRYHRELHGFLLGIPKTPNKKVEKCTQLNQKSIPEKDK